MELFFVFKPTTLSTQTSSMGIFQNRVLTPEPKPSQGTGELPTALWRRQGRGLEVLIVRTRENGEEGPALNYPCCHLWGLTLPIAQMFVELDSTNFVCSSASPSFSKAWINWVNTTDLKKLQSTSG